MNRLHSLSSTTEYTTFTHEVVSSAPRPCASPSQKTDMYYKSKPGIDPATPWMWNNDAIHYATQTVIIAKV